MKKLVTSLFLVLLIIGSISGTILAEDFDVWIMETGTSEDEVMFEEISNKFEEAHPDVNVNVTFVPWSDAHQKFVTAIAGGEVPDVAELGTTWTPEFAKMGALAKTKEFFPEGLYEKSVDSLLKSATFENNLYGLPWYAGVRALVYRKDWFEEEGLEPPKTWEELIEVGKKVQKDTDGDGEVDRYALGIAGRERHAWLPFVWQAGGKFAHYEDGEWVINVNNEEGVEAFQFLSDLKNKHNFMPPDAINWEDDGKRQAFALGKVAMTFAGSWDLPVFREMNPDIEGKIGTALYPRKEKSSAFAGGSNLVVFEGSDNKDLAKEYLELVLSDEYLLKWSEISGYFPGYTHLSDAEMFQDPLIQTFARQLKNSNTYPPTPSWGTLEGNQLFYSTIQDLYSGKDAKETADWLAEEMNDILNRN